MGVPVLKRRTFMGVPVMERRVFMGVPVLKRRAFRGVPVLERRGFRGGEMSFPVLTVEQCRLVFRAGKQSIQKVEHSLVFQAGDQM